MSTITNWKRLLPIATPLVIAMLMPTLALGDEKKPITTTVTVGEMCGGCVKMITARFDKEKEVSKVKCDIAKKSVTFVPRESTRLSPLKLWEIMESIGKKPEKLVSPDGTFTSKPKKS